MQDIAVNCKCIEFDRWRLDIGGPHKLLYLYVIVGYWIEACQFTSYPRLIWVKAPGVGSEI